MFLNLKKKLFIKIAISIFYIISIIFVYKSVEYFLEPLEKEMTRVAVKDIIEVSNNITNQIITIADGHDFIGSVLYNETVNFEVHSALETMQTSNIKYVYIVFKTQNKYRYLIDASPINPSEAAEIFEPINPQRWNDVYISQSTDLIHHINNDTIGFSYLKPIIIKNRVKAILVIDYSHDKLKSIQEIKNKLKMIILCLLCLGLFFFLILLIQTYRTIFLKEKMNTDELTGLYNRHYLKNLEETIDFTKYYVLLIDIDLFKRVNDSYGHNTGDYILSQFSIVLQEYTRKNDHLIRHGGEEFILFIYKDLENIEDYANTIRRRVESYKFVHEGITIPISISIGLYLNDDNAKTLKSSIHQADMALYEAKKLGRNKVVVSSGNIQNTINSDMVRFALENNQIFYEYQPIIKLKDYSISHYEALVRIDDGEKIYYPDDFLSVVENTFIYTRLSKNVILANIEVLKENKNISISINLAPEDLLNDGILELLYQEKKYAHRMLIEVLETQNISYNLLNIALVKLRRLGYKICIDDFGSGYSNFINLLHMDIDYLKLDSSLIKDIANNSKSYTIVESIVLICKKNNIEVIAEYAESEVIIECLNHLGIQYAQGYYFSEAKRLNLCS